MKKTSLLLVAALSMASLVGAQKLSESKVPASVKSAFHQHFPKAKEVKWENEKGNYEANFELASTKQSALFKPSGEMFESEVSISTDELPKSVLAYVYKHHHGQKIKESAKITNAAGEITYEAEVNGKDLIFDANGNFLKEVND
ncbi:MAG: PepSY-like domain-containing protein [Bacteroidetes bacterium]|nr:PepSY-like domain-containing protein [Bacteroidota bacterium]